MAQGQEIVKTPAGELQAYTAEELQNMPIEKALAWYAPNFAAVLPPHIPLDHFQRLVLTAVSNNPDLRYADRRSLFNSCVKCASDGLLPDNREAALVVYKTKVKNRATGAEKYVDLAQYLPMITGIRKRMRNSGEVNAATAEVVHQKDKFHYQLGDDPRIVHEPPPLGEERGEIIGCYARIALASGEILRDVMSRYDVEQSRKQSKAPNSLMWTKFYGEACKKTVLRRCGKAAPSTSVLHTLLNRDFETPDLPAVEGDIRMLPERPVEEDFDETTGEVIDHEPDPTKAGAGTSLTSATGGELQGGKAAPKGDLLGQGQPATS